ncbi:hypothetical protein E2562_001766 [Oryza meyeriana var. granulata]|uniref:Uncharacterized protein n=1 Tax=Oryza meyeriana var. granulata TaxID=110450 RepID=A0A6G1CD87_9ORYZ|nr:hypothetical protein E2562_001766 [Oryza meyeriana var. granulata]
MEAPGGLSLKRKDAEEPELFLCAGDADGGFPLACRATKMRRLVRDDGHHDAPAAAAAADDVAMGDEPSSAEAAEGEGTMVVYEPADSAGGVGLLSQLRRLRPWATLRAGAEWIRHMLREADGRTVRLLLSGAQEEGTGMALVPWGSASASAAMAESTADVAEEEDSDGAAAMEVEEEGSGHLAQTLAGAGAVCGDGYLFPRWPQHCMAPPQLPVVGQASPVKWSW